ncbi:expressed hypothetical protein [Trichoplax adhaerens]|uniref:Uncharacterized protein n=1 Tax=Trichoplax adhaerens TaxID=10228 RepID=B3RIY0_TRIAD|nr:expressed hypothetical protein [Trichoplax adhaerens]EDV29267.1 expressed hypothetical protein [Trichoplax adhaerens]|eukprot:XP_002108469.1 expressed hypothetical protein [Trichoplax adhaerens]
MKLIASIIVIITLYIDWSLAHGSTARIQEIFIGRCSEYQAVNKLQRQVDCIHVWNQFSRVFAFKEPCAVNASEYDNFIKEVSSVFWSGTYSFAHLYIRAVKNLETLENTFPGYLVNSLSWCGQLALPGINYNDCHDPQHCNNKNSGIFWSKMSTWFAQGSSGTVRVLLNSSRIPAFAPYSFFARYELPNLSPSKVNKIEIIVVHDLDMKVNQSERCGAGSIKTLQDLIQQRNIAWSCSDNPSSVQDILCAANPTHFQCQSIHGVLRVVTLAGLGAAGAVILILLIVIILMSRTRSKTQTKAREATKTDF